MGLMPKTYSVLVDASATNTARVMGSLVTVVDGAVTIPAGAAGDYFTIQLDTPFHYDTYSHLYIETERGTACDGNVTIRQAQGLAYNARTITMAQPILLHTRFGFQGGEKLISPDSGTPIAAGVGSAHPFNTGCCSQKMQLLYYANEIQGSGPITGIGIVANGAATQNDFTVRIRLGHSTLTDLGSDYAANFSGTPVTVADNLVFRVPNNTVAGQVIWLPVSGSFNYNGTDNLIVEIDVTDASLAVSNLNWAASTGVANDRKAHGGTGGDTGAPLNQQHQILFRFNGSPLTVNTYLADTSYSFLTTTTQKSQFIYDSTLLNTSGRITSIAFRLGADALAGDYPGTTIRMGQMNNPSVSATFSTNLPSPATVFSGTLSVPAGLKRGDWLTIPVSGFNYDSSQNLVVELESGADAVLNEFFCNSHTVGTNAFLLTTPGSDAAMDGDYGNAGIRLSIKK